MAQLAPFDAAAMHTRKRMCGDMQAGRAILSCKAVNTRCPLDCHAATTDNIYVPLRAIPTFVIQVIQRDLRGASKHEYRRMGGSLLASVLLVFSRPLVVRIPAKFWVSTSLKQFCKVPENLLI